MCPRTTSLRTVCYRLTLALRMVSFLCVSLLFAGLGLIDAGLCRLRPSWHSRQGPSDWVSARLVRLLCRIFPLVLLVPCSWRQRYRVLHLDYPRLLRPGETAWVKLSIQNVGGETWRGGTTCPCRIGVISPLDGSAFWVAAEWLSPTRPAELPAGTETPPAEVAHFRVPIQAPRPPGRYRETWGLVIEGRNWLPTLRAVDVRIEVRQEA